MGAASDPTPLVPVITKILPRKSSTHDVPTSIEIMSQSTSHSDAHKTTAPLPPPPVRRLLSAPSHGGARCSRSSYTVWVSRRIPRAHPHQGLLPHTGPPGTKSDKVPLFPEHPTCHPWGPPCFREPFFFHQSSEEKLRFSSIYRMFFNWLPFRSEPK